MYVDVELGGVRCVWKMDTLVHSNLSQTLKPESSNLLTTRIFLAVPLHKDTNHESAKPKHEIIHLRIFQPTRAGEILYETISSYVTWCEIVSFIQKSLTAHTHDWS